MQDLPQDKVTKSDMPQTDETSSERLAEVVSILTHDKVYVDRKSRGAYVGRRRVGRHRVTDPVTGKRVLSKMRPVERITGVQPGMPGEVMPHETMHILSTPSEIPEAVADDPLTHNVWNSMEDARIDHIGSYRFNRHIFEVHQEMLTPSGDVDMSDMSMHAQATNAVAQIAFGIPWQTTDKRMDLLLTKLAPKIEAVTTYDSNPDEVIKTSIVVAKAVQKLLDKIQEEERSRQTEPDERTGDPDVTEGEQSDGNADESNTNEGPAPTPDGSTQQREDDAATQDVPTPEPEAKGEQSQAESENSQSVSGSEADPDGPVGDINTRPEIGSAPETSPAGATEEYYEALHEAMENDTPIEADNDDLVHDDVDESEIDAMLNEATKSTKSTLKTVQKNMDRMQAVHEQRAEQEASDASSRRQNRVEVAEIKAATAQAKQHVKQYESIDEAYKASSYHGCTMDTMPMVPIKGTNARIDAALSGIGLNTDSYADYSGALAPDHWRAVIGNLKVYEREREASPRIVVLVDNSGSMGSYSYWYANAHKAWTIVKAITDFAPTSEVFTFSSWHEDAETKAAYGDLTNSVNETGTKITPVPHGMAPAHSGPGNADCVALLWMEHFLKTTGDINNTVAIIVSDGAPGGSTSTCVCERHTSQIAHRLADEGLRYASILVGWRGNLVDDAPLYPSEVSVHVAPCRSPEEDVVTQEEAQSIRDLLERVSR